MKYFFNGPDPSKWIAIRILLAFVGGLCAHLIQNVRREEVGKIRMRFFWRGFWFMTISGLGGLSLLRPVDAAAAFLAGVIGWYALLNFMTQKNQGASSPIYKEGVLDESKLTEMLRKVTNG